MAEPATLLKTLLLERHMQSHAAFRREYIRVARRLDPDLASTAPGREQYQRWLSGRVKTKPHPDHCRVLERMFPGRTVDELLRAYRSAEPPGISNEESSTNRRELFRLSGSAVAGTVADRLWSEPSRMHSTLDTTTVSLARLTEMQLAAAQLAVQVVRVPPTLLLDEALMHFRTTRKLTAEKQTLAGHRELVRCAAMLGTLIGEILFNVGQSPLALQWYGVAQRAAEEAGDRYLADIALAGRTYIPMYTPDPRAVLDNVEPRLDVKHGPSPAIAWLRGFQAKAYAMLGDRCLFQKAVDHANRALASSPPDLIRPGILSFVPEKLAFYESRGWVDLGQADAASEAADRAIALYDLDETTEPALVRFEKASALVQAGELPEACRIAATTVLDQHTYLGVTVLTRAEEFDRLLGPATGDAVRDWREIAAWLFTKQPALPVAADGATDAN